LRYCYEEQLQRFPKLQGSLRVDFEIAPSGAVQNAKLAESTLKNAAAEKCVVKGVEKFEFPRPLHKEALAISFPFHFRGVPEKPLPDEEE
jgi:TonB family protein